MDRPRYEVAYTGTPIIITGGEFSGSSYFGGGIRGISIISTSCIYNFGDRYGIKGRGIYILHDIVSFVIDLST